MGSVTHVYDDPFAVVVVVLDGVEVVLARVLRVLMDAVIFVRAQLWQRPARETTKHMMRPEYIRREVQNMRGLAVVGARYQISVVKECDNLSNPPSSNEAAAPFEVPKRWQRSKKGNPERS